MEITQNLGRVTIGKARVDFAGSSIKGGAGQFTIEPKVMAVLRALTDNAGDVVSRDKLIDTVWGSSYGGDERLSRAISILRKAFGDMRGQYQHIETIPKHGYRLIAAVQEKGDQAAGSRQGQEQVALKNSIAVLPFVDMSRKHDQCYFVDGVSEEILNALSHIAELRVTGRTSSFVFKDKNQDIRTIGKSLNVAYVLEGSLRKSGDKLRITAQLVQAVDGFHLWSKTFDGSLLENFDFQDRVAQSIVSELHDVLDISKSQYSRKIHTRSSEAYEYFIRGRQLVHQLNGQNTIRTGIEFLQRSVDADHEFAFAWSWLALGHFILPEFSVCKDWQKHFALSRTALDRALTLDANTSVALLVKGMTISRELRFDDAIEYHKQAVALDPNNVETIAGLGLVMMAIGLPHLAKPYFDRVIEKDPLCGIWHTTYGGVLLSMGKLDKAETSFRRSFELGFGTAAFGVSHRMACKGETDNAIGFMNQNFNGLGPIDQAELKSPLVRWLVYRAYLRGTPISKSLVSLALKRRLEDSASQPTAVSSIGFLFLDQSATFMRAVLEKPNPYIGYTVARIWEPTEESRNIRMHKDFPAFAQRLGLVRAWRQYGWPKQVKPNSDDSNQFTVIA